MLKAKNFGWMVLYMVLSILGLVGAAMKIYRYASGDLQWPDGTLVIPVIGWIGGYLIMFIGGVIMLVKILHEER